MAPLVAASIALRPVAPGRGNHLFRNTGGQAWRPPAPWQVVTEGEHAAVVADGYLARNADSERSESSRPAVGSGLAALWQPDRPGAPIAVADRHAGQAV